MAISKLNHTQISNDFLDNYVNKLSGSDVKVFIAISRKTIGWHKDTDYISISQLSEMTGLGKSQVIESIKKLVEMELIIKNRTKHINEYSINYTDNGHVENSQSPDTGQACPDSEQDKGKTCPDSEHTKESIKETIQKKRPKSESIDFDLSTFFYELIIKHVEPTRKKRPDMNKWAGHINKLRRIDGVPEDVIKKVMIWTANDDFWKSNILSTDKFRKQFDMLEAQSKKNISSKQKKDGYSERYLMFKDNLPDGVDGITADGHFYKVDPEFPDSKTYID